MRIECIGGPLDGEIRVIHEGNGFYIVGQGSYLVPRLFGREIVVAGDGTVTEGTARATWHPDNNDAEDDGA